MNLGPLRSLVLGLNQAAHGVTATVTRPAPDDTPIITTGIWITVPLDELQAYGSVLNRRSPRRVMVLPRAVISTMPNGTEVIAPETLDGATKTWRVDGLERVEVDHWRVILIAMP